MRKRWLLILLLLAAWPSYARQRAGGWCEDGGQTITVPGATGPTTTTWQRSYASCTVTVYDQGTLNLSTIYSDNAGTPKANPFTASSVGQWFFYASDGRYDVRFSGGGIAAPFTVADYVLDDPAASTGDLLPATDLTYNLGNSSKRWLTYLVDKGGQMFNVKAYGAVGNGVTDDSAAIQAAFTAALAGTQHGIVYFPPGNYVANSQLLNYTGTGVFILGAGAEASIITSGYNGDLIKVNAAGIVASGPLMDMSVEGIQVQGNNGANAVAFHIQSTTGTVFRDVAILNFTGTSSIGVWAENISARWTERLTWDHCHFNANTYGIRFTVNGGTNSFFYSHILASHFGVGVGQFGVSVGATAALNGAQWQLASNCPGTLFDVTGDVVESKVDFAVEGAGTVFNGAGNFITAGYWHYDGLTYSSGAGKFLNVPLGTHNQAIAGFLGSYLGTDGTRLLATDEINPGVTNGQMYLATASNFGASRANALLMFNGVGSGAFRVGTGSAFSAFTQTAAISSTGVGSFSTVQSADGGVTATNTNADVTLTPNGTGLVKLPTAYRQPACALTLANGLNSNVTLGQCGFYSIGGVTGAFSIGGLTNPTDGRVLIIVNPTTQAMTITNEDGSSTVTNRILTLTGGDLAVGTTNYGAVTLLYSSALTRWLVIAHNP